MKQLSFILFILLIVTLLFTYGYADKPEEIIKYKIDSDGNIISSKVIKREEETDVLSDEESTFQPDGNFDDDIPAELENDENKNEIAEITIDSIDSNEEEEEVEVTDDGFLGHFITVHMGDFIHHPYENEMYRIKEEEENDKVVEEQPPVIAEEVDIQEKIEKIQEQGESKANQEQQETEKEEIVKDETDDQEKQEADKEEIVKDDNDDQEQDIETQNKVQMMEEIETEESDKSGDHDNENEKGVETPGSGEEGEEESVKGGSSMNNDHGDGDDEEVEVVEIELVMDENVIFSQSSEMKNFFRENKRIMMGCFESHDHDDYIRYRNASNVLTDTSNFSGQNYFNGDELKFFTIQDKHCRDVVKQLTGITMFKNDVVYCVHHRCYEYPPSDLDDTERFRNFILDQELPVVSDYQPNKKDIYKKWNIPFLIYLNKDEKKTKEDVHQFLGKIGERYQDDFVLFTSNDANFDIDTLDEPRDHNVLLFAPEFQTMYSIQEILEPEDAIDQIAVEFFIAQYYKGVLTPRIIIQEFESMWDYENYVVKSVPRLYYPHALNPTRDSLVVYYKIDCPFSQELLKTLEKLGKKYANYRTKFSIVKYEAEDQKIPKMSLWRNLEGYPTIVLYKANPFSREKKYYYVYPENAGRSSVSLDRWIQTHSFYKPKIIFNEEDYKEKEILDVDAEEINETEEEEERINSYLEDPNLIYTRFGYGKEIENVNVNEDEDEDDKGVEYYFDNVTPEGEIPITGTYYELTSTTYVVKTSHYTPPPSIYDDDDGGDDTEKKEDKE
ncbi:hypothetical protein BCR36DRAFT_408723 [Piromyces finnis]|uniref:Thioredoxin domain-containing protein n=1 Tax=Piromyces finnis TaxID=1754191 RepID=A0A1Y1VL53_9FUNG|nr:hypothetical protein BCR36DRAFT_408723 [Piromyces finnis]|eukprot:ORX59209.1 hypothetical protein BCR36DRAFT_408723 [Piromyces finnis]